jgi:hypothetical protein
MVYVYCDESGHERRDQYMFIAGFLGRESNWTALAREWKEAIGKRRNFHLKTLFRKPERSRKLLTQLGMLPEKHRLLPLLSGVRADDYWDIVQGTTIEKFAKAYCVALYPIVLDALIFIPDTERVEFVMETQIEYQPYADRIFNAVAEYSEPRLKTEGGKSKLANWSYVPKASSILTQPADYLAFAALQHYRDPNGAKWDICRAIVEPYLANVPDLLSASIVSKERMRGLIEETGYRTLRDIIYKSVR